MIMTQGAIRNQAGCLLVAALLGAGVAGAQETVWTATASSVSFTNAANWSAGVPGTAAGVNDTAVFTNNRVQTINITSVPQCANAAFQSGTGTVTLATGTASTYAWIVTNSLVLSPLAATTNTVVQTGNGILSITNAAGATQATIGQNGVGAYTGKLNANTVTVGANSGSVGTLTLTAGSLGSLVLGAAAGSQGSYTINPGSVTNGSLTLGAVPGSSGTLNWGGRLMLGGVTDPNTLVNTLLGSSFGKDRSQTLAITTNYVNATLLNGLTLGENAGGTGVLTWAAGVLAVTNDTGTSTLTVGSNGAGAFNLNRGTAYLDALTLASTPGSAGAMTWGGYLTVGGVSDPNALANTLLGTSFGKDRSQTLAVTTNYVSASLPNGLILGENAGGIGNLAWAGGTLAITNSSATSPLIVGAGGSGSCGINGDTAIIDRVIATNYLPTATNSPFSLGGGTLTTRGNSEVLVPSNGIFRINGTWNVAGGSVAVHSTSAYGDFQIAANSALVLSGPSTVFTSALWVANNNNVLFQGAGAQLIVSNGAQMVFAQRPAALLPFTKGTMNNVLVLVSDPGSLLNATNFNGSAGWRVSDGNFGYSQFIVSNQAQASVWQLSIGCNNAYNNTGLVTAAGQLTAFGDVAVSAVGYGTSGRGNVLIVSSSGQVSCVNGYIGYDYNNAGTVSANGNGALVTDPGSLWRMSKSLYVGYAMATQYVSDNVLRIANWGTVAVTNVVIGNGPGSNCLLSLDSGGVLLATNAIGGATVRVLRGAVSNDGGVVVTDQLIVNTNSGSCFLRSGSISSRNTTYSNGTAFVVGGSANRAVFQMLGGSHGFSNGLTVAANGMFAGTGTVVGVVTVAGDGMLAPGFSNAPGTLAISGSLALQEGALLSADVSAVATDRVVVAGTVTLPAMAKLQVTLPDGYNPRQPAVLLSAATLAGMTDLSGWSVANHPELAPSIQNGTSVVLGVRVLKGTVFLFR